MSTRRRPSRGGYSYPRSRRRTTYRRGRRSGFWRGFAHHTHTDNLRHRIGGAAGRSVLRLINKFRKNKIPLRGTWTGGRPKAKPTKAGPGMKIYPKGTYPGPSRWPGSVSVTGAGAGARGRRGRPGPKGHPQPPKQPPKQPPAGPSATATATATAKGRPVPHRPVPPVQPTPPTQPIPTGTGWPTGGPPPAPPWGTPPTTPTTNTTTNGGTMTTPTTGGGGGGSYGSGADHLGQAPETDAEHSAWADQFAQDLTDLGDRLREHREMLEAEVNMHPSVMAGLDEAAEHLSEAASGVTNHAQDYASTYEGIRETAAATEGHIPGDPNNRYWGETA